MSDTYVPGDNVRISVGAGQLSFLRNGEPLGIAFTDEALKGSHLYVKVILGCRGD